MASAQRILRFLAGRFRDTQTDGKVYAVQNGALLDVTNITQKALATVPLTVSSTGQTVFTVPGGYTPGLLQVARNGILQSFTGTNGTSITLSSGTSSTSDTVTAYVFSTFQVANALMLSGGTMTGQLVSPGITMTGSLNQAPIVSLASAATVNIGAAAANDLTITGTTAITAFDTVASGVQKRLTFAGALTLTYNATSLILPGAANITTAAGDVATFVSLGGGNWRCVGYQLASSIGGGSGSSGAFAKYYESSPVAVTASSVSYLKHGFGVLPKVATAHLVFKRSVGSYSIGDVLEFSAHGMTNATGGVPLFELSYDATNIFLIFGAGLNVTVIPKFGGTGAAYSADNTFNVVVKAWL